MDNASILDGWLDNVNFYTISAFELSVVEPTMITALAGVGGSFGDDFGSVPIVNVYSDLNAFAADQLTGDIHNQTGSLVTTNPPPFGVMKTGWQNHYYEYEITPFLLQPGTYVLSVYHINAGEFYYAESASNISSDWMASTEIDPPGTVLNWQTDLGYATGTLAIDVRSHAVGSEVPTVSEWGVAVMSLLLLTAGTIVYTKRYMPEKL